MRLPLSESRVPKLEWRSSVGSTNDELIAQVTGGASTDWPDLSVLVTDNQTRGRGRLDRRWIASPGKSLAVSVLFRPRSSVKGSLFPVDSLGWLPLLAGAAMVRTVASFIDDKGASDDVSRISLKWPNDVLVGDAKIAGVLSELLPEGTVVVGAGLNLTQSKSELPVPTATSLRLAGSRALSVDAVLCAYLDNLQRLYLPFLQHEGVARESGLWSEVIGLCSTVNERVRVEFPGGETITGLAKSIDDFGHLQIERDEDGSRTVVSAGDITHLRHR